MFSFKKKQIFALFLAIIPALLLCSEQKSATKPAITPKPINQQFSTVCEYFYSPTGLLTVALTCAIVKARGLAIIGLGALAFAYSDVLLEGAKNYLADIDKSSNTDNAIKNPQGNSDK